MPRFHSSRFHSCKHALYVSLKCTMARALLLFHTPSALTRISVESTAAYPTVTSKCETRTRYKRGEKYPGNCSPHSSSARDKHSFALRPLSPTSYLPREESRECALCDKVCVESATRCVQSQQSDGRENLAKAVVTAALSHTKLLEGSKASGFHSLLGLTLPRGVNRNIVQPVLVNRSTLRTEDRFTFS